MKTALLRVVLLLAALHPAPLPAAEAVPLRVASYNLRFAGQEPPNAWANRRPLMQECLAILDPDLLGTQEGLYPQLQDLAADLPTHEWIGLGRQGGSKGEFMAVFYRRNRFTPVAYDHFWLSDTPDRIGSTSWGNRIPRMVTWVRFRDHAAGNEFLLVNTHFDHESQPARERSAALLRDRLAALPAALPIIVTGDFNADAGVNPAFTILTAEGFLRDTWDTAAERRGDTRLNTFNGFAPAQREGRRIDWILTRGPVATRMVEIMDFAREGRYPSDHFPVVAELVVAGP